MEVIIPQCKDKLGNKQLSRLITKVGVGEKTKELSVNVKN